MQIKKIKNPNKYALVETMIAEGEASGYDFIELGWKQPSGTTEIIMGVDQAVFYEVRRVGSPNLTDIQGEIVADGSLYFYPDAAGRCWGYLLDTESNREFLAGQLEYPVVTITDKTVRNEITKLAIKMGNAAEEATIQDSTIIDALGLESKDAEIDKLKAELAKAKAETVKAEEKKPLTGTKINKNKNKG